MQPGSVDEPLGINPDYAAFVLDAFGAAGYELNLVTGVLCCSPRLNLLYGYPESRRLTLADCLARHHPADGEGPAAIVTAAIVSGERRFQREFRILLPGGGVRWVLSRGEVLFDAGRPAFVRGAAIDITERKTREANSAFLDRIMADFAPLKTADDILRAASGLTLAYFGLSRCVFVEINEAADEARVIYDLGVSDLPSLVGTYSIADFHTDDERRELAAGNAIVVADVADDPRTADAVGRFQQLRISALVNASYVSDGSWQFVLSAMQERPRAWRADEVELLRELSARIWPRIARARAEARLRESEASLQRLYAQEQAARAQAEEASRLKDEFLATVSHELRTPLTAILGYGQLLQRRKRDEAYVAHTVELIMQSARSQSALIEDLLDVSRIVSGKLRIASAPVDLASVIRAALDTVRPTVEAKGLRLEVVLGPTAATVLGDANRLQQVAWNLLANAAKFTPAGGRIAVRLRASGGGAELTVSDSGQGICADFLPYVFDHFRQADSSSQRAHGGLGLGLAIVRRLVELHGGSVCAASEGPGLGATFTVRLPLHAVAAAASQDAPGAPGPHEPACPLGGMRLVVVDDQPAILALLDELLTSDGAVVRLCATAPEALAEVRSWRPDALVSDIAMPGNDGYWLIREVRRLPPQEGGTTPAAALTAYVRAEDRLQVLAAGFQQYVPKPMDATELREALLALVRAPSQEIP